MILDSVESRFQLVSTKSYLKKVFCPNFCVGPLLQLLGILQYACGLKFGPALNLNQNPFFEITSNRSTIDWIEDPLCKGRTHGGCARFSGSCKR